jgi:predicted ferric reductase
MKRIAFLVVYFLTAVVPIVLYLRSVGTGLDSYSVSVALGITAFILLCNQFILASKPSFAIAALGTKKLQTMHSTVPVFILIFAGAHKLLKESNGFPEDTLQSRFGAATWLLLAIVMISTVLFMANTFWFKLVVVKNLRAWVYATSKLSYKGARLMHNLTVLAAIMILVHVLLASSGSLAANPAGIALMCTSMLLALVMYGRYRMRGRPVPKIAAQVAR